MKQVRPPARIRVLFGLLAPILSLSPVPAGPLGPGASRPPCLAAGARADALVLDCAASPGGDLVAWVGKAPGQPGYPTLRLRTRTGRALDLPPPLATRPARRPRFSPDGARLTVELHGAAPSEAVLSLAPDAEGGDPVPVLQATTPLPPEADPAPGTSLPEPPQDPPPLLLRGVRIPGLAGARTRVPQDVRIRHGRIERIAPRLAPRPGETLLPAHGSSLVPGLWDCHVHPAPGMGPELLSAGITSVVDLGSSALTRPDPSEPWPRVLSAGRPLEGPTPLWDPIGQPTQGPEALAAHLERLLAGPRPLPVLKGYGSFPPALLPHLERAAADARIPLFLDLSLPVAEVLSRTRTAGLAHTPDPQGGIPAMVDELVASPRWIISTLSAFLPPPLEGSAPSVLEGWWQGGGIGAFGTSDREALVRRGRRMERFLRAWLPRDPGHLLIGTDCGPSVPGLPPRQAMAREIALLAHLGAPLSRLLEAATVEPARAFGDRQRGLVGEGRIADLVLLEGDPLQDPSAYQRVRLVILGGRVVAGDQSSLGSASGKSGRSTRR